MIWCRNITISLHQCEIDLQTSQSILINYEIIHGISI